MCKAGSGIPCQLQLLTFSFIQSAKGCSGYFYLLQGKLSWADLSLRFGPADGLLAGGRCLPCLELDLWQVYPCGDVGAPCTKTLDVSRPRPSQRGCLLVLPFSVFTIDRAYPNT